MKIWYYRDHSGSSCVVLDRNDLSGKCGSFRKKFSVNCDFVNIDLFGKKAEQLT